MNKQAVKRMIKSAKASAKDKAMEIAANLGKPTSAGLVTGAGLGTILAALGAIKRNGEDPDNTSIMSNPLLLGTLGAAGGYLAGNALDKAPSVRADKELSNSALLGLAGGAGLLGTSIAKQDAEDKLKPIERHFKTITRQIPQTVNGETGSIEYHLNKRRNRSDKLVNKPLPRTRKEIERAREELLDFNKTKDELSTALRRAGKYEEAKTLTGYTHPEKLGRRFIEKLKNSPVSPISWLRALNPLKQGRSGYRFVMPGSLISKAIRNSPVKARLAALALLAGGGKAIYDYTSD